MLVFIIAARVERTHEARTVEAVLLRHPLRHRLVDIVRGVAVVGRLLLFELLEELVVFLVTFLPLRSVLLLPVEPVGSIREAELLHVDALDLVHVDPEGFRVEARVHRELVVRQGVGPPLFLGQPVQADALRFLIAQLLQSFIAAMAFDDEVVVAPDADRVGVPKLLDALDDLPDLPARVRFRVLRVGRQLVQRYPDYLHRFS